MLWWFRPWRRGWHPWLFMLSVGTAVAALVAGDLIVFVIAGVVVWWTVVAGRRR